MNETLSTYDSAANGRDKVCDTASQESLTFATLRDHTLLRTMAPITLDQMRGVKLMNRVDTKYVLSEEEVLAVLQCAANEGFRVQVIDDKCAARYDTLYYDTAERAMYIAHHNRQLTRQKVRTRHYAESGVTYLEIKNKSNRGRTSKRRVEIETSELFNFSNNSAAVAFFESSARYALTELSPALATHFTRITLVNHELTERITIDLDLRYEDVRSGRSAAVRGMAIVEVKQEGTATSAIKRILSSLRIQPLKISKYCLGTSLTVEGIKRNRMQQKLRTIEKRIGYNRVIINNITA